MLRVFTIGRSLAGIYWELRRLRMLTESYFRYVGIPLPETSYERFRKLFASDDETAADLQQPEFDEEAEARQKVDQIMKDLAAGRDPGTKYRPWT